MRVQTAADIILNAKERTYWMEPLCFPGCLTLLYAPRGVGKSLFTLWWAMCLAAEEAFFKYLPSTAVRAMIIDAEMGRDELYPRLAEFGTHITFDSKNLIFITPDLCEGFRTPNLADAVGQAEIDAIIEKHNIQVVFVDNYNTGVRPLLREDDVQTWDRYEAWLIKQRSLGRMVVTVHHAGKSGAQLGTSRKEQIQNIILALKHPHDYEMKQGARFTLVVEKMRHGKGKDLEGLNITYDPTLSPPWGWQTDGNALAAQVSEMQAARMSAREISQTLGVSLFRVKQMLRADRIEVDEVSEKELDRYF